jgi:hypothetical protein
MDKRSRDNGQRTATVPTAEDPEAQLGKMASGGNDLRDHDFPVSRVPVNEPSGAVAVETGAPAPESLHSGGEPGTVPGDTQKVGTVGTIVDQDEIDPDNYADR